MMGHADETLYEAKSSRRNRCVVWKDPNMQIANPHRRVLKAGQILFNVPPFLIALYVAFQMRAPD